LQWPISAAIEASSPALPNLVPNVALTIGIILLNLPGASKHQIKPTLVLEILMGGYGSVENAYSAAAMDNLQFLYSTTS